jgi:excisionase family DNA binding protein
MPSDATPAEPLLLTVNQASAALAVCTKTLWALTRAGKLRAVHVGTRGIRYSLSDLREFIESAKAPPEAHQ